MLSARMLIIGGNISWRKVVDRSSLVSSLSRTALTHQYTLSKRISRPSSALPSCPIISFNRRFPKPALSISSASLAKLSQLSPSPPRRKSDWLAQPSSESCSKSGQQSMRGLSGERGTKVWGREGVGRRCGFVCACLMIIERVISPGVGSGRATPFAIGTVGSAAPFPGVSAWSGPPLLLAHAAGPVGCLRDGAAGLLWAATRGLWWFFAVQGRVVLTFAPVPLEVGCGCRVLSLASHFESCAVPPVFALLPFRVVILLRPLLPTQQPPVVRVAAPDRTSAGLPSSEPA